MFMSGMGIPVGAATWSYISIVYGLFIRYQFLSNKHDFGMDRQNSSSVLAR